MPNVSADMPRRDLELRPRFQVATGDYVTALQLTRDGRICVVGLGDGRALGFELTTGKQVFSVQAHKSVLGVSLSPDGRCFATCGHDSAAKIWSMDGALVRELPGGGGAWVEHVAWAPAGGRIATTSGKKIRVWTEQGEPIVES
jgi:WD40 repeat protein